MSTPHRNRVLRAGYVLLGLCSLALGGVGLVVPGMPGTVFFLVALWAFERSNPRLEHWLLNNRVIGPVLRDWRESRAMSKKAKIWATASVWVMIGVSISFLRNPYVAACLLAVAIGLTWFFFTRKTRTAAA